MKYNSLGVSFLTHNCPYVVVSVIASVLSFNFRVPSNIADKSDPKVNIVSSIEFKVFPELPAVADLNTTEPPKPVPLPAPPCNIKLPPAISFVVPAVVEPPLIVRVLPAALSAEATTPMVPSTASCPKVKAPVDVMAPQFNVDVPILILPKPLVIEPLFKAPVVTIPEPPAICEYIVLMFVPLRVIVSASKLPLI